MTQQQLSTVVLRLFGVYYTFFAVSHMFINGVMYQAYSHLPTLGEVGLVTWLMFSVHFLLHVCAGLILIFFAKRVSKWIFPNDELLITGGLQSSVAIFRSGISLLGIYILAGETPEFIAISIQWIKERAAPPSPMLYQFDMPMLRSVVAISVAAFLVFKARWICDKIGGFGEKE